MYHNSSAIYFFVRKARGYWGLEYLGGFGGLTMRICWEIRGIYFGVGGTGLRFFLRVEFWAANLASRKRDVGHPAPGVYSSGTYDSADCSFPSTVRSCFDCRRACANARLCGSCGVFVRRRYLARHALCRADVTAAAIALEGGASRCGELHDGQP